MAQRIEKKDLGLRSEICSFGTLLGEDYYFNMPYLQRPYEWGVAEVADMIGDLLSASNGKYPVWSRCAWVRTTASMLRGSTGNCAQFFKRSDLNPWNRPQSTRRRWVAFSTTYFEPVTVPAPPRKDNFRLTSASALAR